MRASVDREIAGDALLWLLQRPQRVARIMSHWRDTWRMVEEIVRSVHLICADRGIEPDAFNRTFDPTVTINAGQRYIIIQLDET